MSSWSFQQLLAHPLIPKVSSSLPSYLLLLLPKFQRQLKNPERRMEDANSPPSLNQVQTFLQRSVNIIPSTYRTGRPDSIQECLLEGLKPTAYCLPARATTGDSASLPPFILWLLVAFFTVCVHARLPICVCVHVQRKTSFRVAGIYYIPNKRGRRIVYELLAFQRQQRPVFS